jgi:dUTP pyrophosphatase
MKITKLSENAVLPTKGSSQAAGYDLYACLKDSITIEPNETVMIKTGISIALPEGTFGGIFARSGLATKQGLRPANCVGVIDSDYRGEIMVAIHNDNNSFSRMISNHDRIAQLIVIPYLNVEFEEVENLDSTERGNGGFGSSGK